VVTLLALAEELAGRLGLPPELERQVGRGYLELARGAIAAASAPSEGSEGSEAGVAGALTGPVARGDAVTFRRQVEALAELAPERVPLVLHLAQETLRQKARNGASPEALDTLRREIERRLKPI